MNKRAFLRYFGLGSAALVIEGCATNQNLGGGLGGLLGNDGHNPLPMSQADVAASRQARQVFDAFRQTGRLPTAKSSELQNAVNNWNSVASRFQGVSKIAFDDSERVVLAMAPALRLSNGALQRKTGGR